MNNKTTCGAAGPYRNRTKNGAEQTEQNKRSSTKHNNRTNRAEHKIITEQKDEMQSIGPECNELKKTYEACFNQWFSEKFLKGEKEDTCAPVCKGMNE